MQLMRIVVATCVPLLAASHLFRLRISEEARAEIKEAEADSARWSADAKLVATDREHLAEQADNDFWAAQWEVLEKDARKLEQSLEVPSTRLLQIRNSSAQLDKIQSMVKGLTGKAALAPMLAMLKGMYQDQKKRIGDLNKKEEQSKKRFAKEEAQYKQRVKELEDKGKLHKLDAEFIKNGTQEYKRQFTYWQHVRERNHRQFHNTLKITHGMMQREKDMISQYEKALAMPDQAPGAANGAAAAAKPAAPAEAPEVVLEQQRTEFRKFCRDALVEIHHEMHPRPKHLAKRRRSSI